MNPTALHRGATGPAGIRRAFSLVELLTVIALLGMLIGILLPAVSAAREAGRRTVCRANLSDIGKALHMYASEVEYGSKLPSLPHKDDAAWHWIGYEAASRVDSTDPTQNCDNLRALYLLIRLKMTTPEMFICPTSDERANYKATDYWDFPSRTNCSYSYQCQWGGFTTNKTDSEMLPIMADRNPLISYTLPRPADATYDEGRATTLDGPPRLPERFITKFRDDGTAVLESANSPNHNGQGQNVLFLGGRVEWFSTPLAGLSINGTIDNIYTVYDKDDTSGDGYGRPLEFTDADGKPTGPYDRTDAFLVP